MKTNLLIVLMILTTTSFAGSTNIELDCSSNSGRTKLSGNIPGDEYSYNVSFSIDSNKIVFKNLADLASVEAYEALSDGIFSLKLSNYETHEFLSMHALPQTVKFKQEGLYGNWSSTFQAKIISTTHPNKNKRWAPVVILNCSASYFL